MLNKSNYLQRGLVQLKWQIGIVALLTALISIIILPYEPVSAFTTNPSCTQTLSPWQLAAPVPARHLEGSAAVVNGKLYLLSGFTSSGPLVPTNRVDVYNPATNTWETAQNPRSPMPFAGAHIQAAVDGQYIWLVGGFMGPHPGPTTDAVWRYDTVNDLWTPGPDLPQQRASGATAVVGRILHYMSGVASDRNTNPSTHYVLNLNNPVAWTTAAPVPRPRNHFQGIVIDGLIYTIGGQLNHDISPVDVNYLDIYNPATNSWTPGANLAIIRSHFEPGTFKMNDRVIAVGGRSGNTLALNRVSEYNPQTNTWSELRSLPTPLYEPSAGVIGNTVVVTAGGYRWDQLQTDTWVSQLSTNCVLSDPVPSNTPNGSATATPTSTVAPSATIDSQPTTLYRINAGGNEINFNGTIWAGDQFASGGQTSVMTGAVAGTTNDALYYQTRSSTSNTSGFSYNLPVTNGSYRVNLHFAEVYWVGGSGRGATGTNRRVFDVQIEGALVLDNLDLNAAAGPLNAYVRTFTVNVIDGTLNINFPAASVDRPIISAIEVISNQLTLPSSTPTSSSTPTATHTPSNTAIPSETSIPSQTPVPSETSIPSITPISSETPIPSNTPIPSETPEPSNTPIPSETPIPSTTPTQTSTPTATSTSTTTATPTATFTPSATLIAEPTLRYRINAGGSLITFGGVAWNADANFSGGRNSTMTGAIAGTTNDALYYQSRVSDADTTGFSYNFPVANGNYTVNLHFAEIYWVGGSGRGQAGANRRVFDVQLEGALVIDNLDLYATAGPLRAYVRTFTANVTDGNLSINFPRATVNRPIISAIEVFQNSTTNLLLSGVNTSQRITAPTSTLVPSATVISSATLVPTFAATTTFLPTLTPTSTYTPTSTSTVTPTLLPSLTPSLTPKPIIPPSANAGEDQTIIDVDSDGPEIVVLNGLNSIDTDGTIMAGLWTREGIEIAVGLNPSVTLPIGVHTITLTVTDDSGAIATDTVTVTIAAPPAQ